MSGLLFLCLAAVITGKLIAGSELSIAFPNNWDGDKFTEANCPSNSTIPSWLNGYFLGQLSASFGDQSSPNGSHMTHLFDGQGAIASFHLKDGFVHFSARYYPARPFKIWDFYGRDMTASKVAWYTVASEYSEEAINLWSNIKVDSQMTSNPNVDFWRVGHDIIGGTETPDVGYTFNVPGLNEFKMFKFKETSDIFGPKSTIAFMNMPIHERIDSSGNLWASVGGFDYEQYTMYQFLFTVDPNGVRTVVGNYTYGQFNKSECQPDHSYGGDIGVFPSYMHSITSTENYIILPLTSFVQSLCRFRSLADPLLEGNMRFLVFDKRNNSWATPKPISYPQTLFVTHQMNAYEDVNGNLIADMLTFKKNVYNILQLDNILNPEFQSTETTFTRFTINLQSQSVSARNLLSQPDIDGEFTQINHKYDGKSYKYTYFVYRPFKLNSIIYKLNVQNSTNSQMKGFTAGDKISLGEPWFVQNPGTTGEDDGILLVRGLNTYARVSHLFVLNATDMSLIGYSTAPTAIPFGLHNRYYSVEDLGINDPITTVSVPTVTNTGSSTVTGSTASVTVGGTTTSESVTVQASLTCVFILSVATLYSMLVS